MRINGLITNLEGELVQHVEYHPFGASFIEEQNEVWNTPYLLDAMEYDAETEPTITVPGITTQGEVSGCVCIRWRSCFRVFY